LRRRLAGKTEGVGGKLRLFDYPLPARGVCQDDTVASTGSLYGLAAKPDSQSRCEKS
jgi:hypothetical protein